MRLTSRLFHSFAACLIALTGIAAAPNVEPDKDENIAQLLQEAQTLLTDHKPSEALEKCDAVIKKFLDYYLIPDAQRVYCARSQPEVLFYLLKNSADADRGTATAADAKGAKVLSSTWSDAYFMKAYALIELRRVDDAKTAIGKALELSPVNARYLCELGMVHQLEKNWEESSKQYTAALKNVEFSPEASKAIDLGRARRGLAYNHIELGKLDEAEKLYLQCLESDPADARAAKELEYVRSLKAKNENK